MKTFKIFLESISYEESIDGDIGSRYYSITHSSSIGPHTLDVTHSISTVRNKKHIDTDFSVDDSLTSRGDKDPSHSRRILTTVRKSVHDIIDREKPHRINFHGNTEDKHNTYGIFAKSLARKYGGKYTLNGDMHSVDFKWSK